MAAQLEMVNTLLSDAEAVCTGRAHMTKEYNPEPGDSWFLYLSLTLSSEC